MQTSSHPFAWFVQWFKQFYDPVVFEDDIPRSVSLFALKIGLSTGIVYNLIVYFILLLVVRNYLILTSIAALLLLVNSLALYSINKTRTWVVILFCVIVAALLVMMTSIWVTGFLTGYITLLVGATALVAVSSGFLPFLLTTFIYTLLSYFLYTFDQTATPKTLEPDVFMVTQIGLHVYGGTVVALLLYSYRIVARRATRLYYEKASAQKSLQVMESNINLINRIVHTFDEMMFTVDSGHRITLVNRALCRAIGYKANEIVGQPLEMILDMQKGVCRCKNGDTLWVTASSASLTDDQGLAIGTLWIMRDQSALRQAESQMEMLSSRYEQALGVANAGVFEAIMPDYIYLDPNLRNLLGLNDSFNSTQLIDWIQYLHPDDVDTLAESMRKLVENQVSSIELLFRSQTPRGMLWMMMRATRITNGFTHRMHILGTVIDVTERHNIEQELRQRDRVLEAINYAAERYLTTDDWAAVTPEVLTRLGEAAEIDSLSLFVNTYCDDDVLRFSQSFLWFKNPVSVDFKQDYEIRYSDFDLRPYVDTMLKGVPVVVSVEMMPPIIRKWFFPLEVKQAAAMPILVDGQWWGFITFNFMTLEDNHWPIVRLELLQTAAGILALAIQRTRTEHQKLHDAMERERMRILSTFMTKAEHEFKTPLTVISTATYLLSHMEEGENERRAAKLNQIQEQVGQINKLVEAMVLMTRLDIEPFAPLQTLPLNELVKNAMLQFIKLAQQKEVALVFIPLPETVHITCDETKLERALRNMIENAITFTPKGGRVHLWVQVTDNMAHISIADNGIGMDEGTRAQIFDNFFRQDKAHSTRGFGLGLPIAKRIVELHGGSISLESQPHHGSTFTVHIPLNQANDTPPSTVKT